MAERRGIAIILPPLEGCSEQRFGAISLSVCDFIRHSADADITTVYGGDQAAAFEGLHYQSVNIKRPRFFGLADRYLWHLFFHLRALRPALIEIHNRPRLAKVIVRFGIAPVVLFLHNDPRTMRRSASPRARRWLSKRLVGVFCVSNYLANCWREGLGDASCPVQVVPLGIPLPAPATIEKQNTILFVGRIIPEKGVHEFARALTIALPQLPDWRGIVIGGRRFTPSDIGGDYETELARLMGESGPHATWKGLQSHEVTLDALAKAAIVVIPSVWEEPFGRIAIEAMSRGCAVITSGRGGLGEIIGDAGMLTEPTPEALASAITELATNPAHRTKLQKRALQRVEAYAIARCSQHLDHCRRQMMER